MEVFDAVRTALAVRAYRDTPVPREAVLRILEAGRLTGSSKNGQPWHFIVVEDRETLKRLSSMVRSGPYVAQAPVAIVIAVENTRFALSDASRAIQSMILTGWADGLGSNWVGFAGMTDVKPVVGVPAEFDVIAILPFGYPTQRLGRGKKRRKALQDVAHGERFGRPFA